MGDIVKIGVKTALIVGIMAAALLILNGVVIPTINVQPIGEAVGKGLAIVTYYCGPYTGLVALWMVLLGIRYVAIPAYKVTMVAIRWIMKVNE